MVEGDEERAARAASVTCRERLHELSSFSLERRLTRDVKSLPIFKSLF